VADQEAALWPTRRQPWGRPGGSPGAGQEAALGPARRQPWGRPGGSPGADQEAALGPARRYPAVLGDGYINTKLHYGLDQAKR